MNGDPPADVDADDTYVLRWKLHCLDLALGGLLDGPHAVEPRDLQALKGLVHELIALAPWPADEGRELTT
jgi:hypothetical protein